MFYSLRLPNFELDSTTTSDFIETQQASILEEPWISSEVPPAEVDGKNQNKWMRFWSMVKLVAREIKSRPEIMLCYWTYIFVRFFSLLNTSFYISWVSSFFEHSSEGQKEAISTANEILFWSNLALCPLIIIWGAIADKIRSIFIYPMFIVCLGGSWLLIMYSDRPYSAQGFIGQSLLIGSTLLLTIQNQGLMYKLWGNKVRGPMIAIGIFFGSIGFTIAGKLLGYLSTISPSAPFFFGAWFSGGFLVITTILTLFKYFKS